MHKLFTFLRYFKDFIQYRQFKLVIASFVYIAFKKSFLDTRICKGKLGYYLHRKGTLDFQFGNYAYEWSVKSFMLSQVKNYTVFIDVGANMGTYTLLMQNLGLKTISFEPSSSNYNALTINLRINNFHNNARTYSLGLSSKNSHEKFYYDPLNTGASHMGSVSEYDHVSDQRALIDEVDLVTFDSMTNQLNLTANDAVLMKIDVEGMEKDVLEGASLFIREQQKLLIVIESVHSGEAELKRILDQLADFEYFPIDQLNFAARKRSNS